jgi:hypothetical protein
MHVNAVKVSGAVIVTLLHDRLPKVTVMTAPG